MTSKNTKQSTIFIVDDAPEELKALISFLETSGFRISADYSGEAAINRIEHIQPDIILLDVLMPDMDGFETCRRLKERETSKDIPIIFMTAVSDAIDKVKGFEVGGVDYLTKPVEHTEVLARVNAHLTNHTLQQQLQEQNTRLAEQNQRFQKLSEATFEGILIHDAGTILEVNQMLEKMFGYQRTEVLGRSVLEFVTPESRNMILEHIRTKNGYPYKAEGIRKDGSSFPLEIQAKTMPYEGRDVRVAAIRDLSWRKAMEEEKQQILRSTSRDRYKFGEIIGKSPVMQEVYQSVVKASASEAHVVIYGESGTGKELVARTIHDMSQRKKHNFVAVNCGAVPESLFEREFFGHRRGAFTGADRDKPGYFDRAHHGTLFLDEIGELPPNLQVKLLRVLEEKEYRPLGDTGSKKTDVRIIAATNKDLRELLHKGVIREDFFYRIQIIVVTPPPLRDRKEDIPLLIDNFLKQYGKNHPCSPIPAHITKALCTYDWPGNVRELQNEIQRYLAAQELEFIKNIPVGPSTENIISISEDGIFPPELRDALEVFEKQYVLKVLQQNQGHRGNTAKMLGLPRRTLSRKMQKYQITFPNLEP